MVYFSILPKKEPKRLDLLIWIMHIIYVIGHMDVSLAS